MVGDEFTQLPNHNAFLSKETLLDLVRKYKQSEGHEKRECLETICGSMWRMVYQIARKYANIIGFETAVQEGYIGLIKSLDRIDLTTNSSLTTVAPYWIRMTIIRAMYDDYSVNIPERVYEFISKMLSETKDTDTSSDEIISAVFGNDYTYADLVKYSTVQNKPYRLDNIHNVDNPSEGTTQAVKYELTDTSVSYAIIENRKDLQDLLNIIPNDRMRFILIHSYGLEGEVMTLAALGAVLHITGERVRQLRIDGINYIRKHLGLSRLNKKTKRLRKAKDVNNGAVKG